MRRYMPLTMIVKRGDDVATRGRAQASRARRHHRHDRAAALELAERLPARRVGGNPHTAGRARRLAKRPQLSGGQHHVAHA